VKPAWQKHQLRPRPLPLKLSTQTWTTPRLHFSITQQHLGQSIPSLSIRLGYGSAKATLQIVLQDYRTIQDGLSGRLAPASKANYPPS